MSAYLCDNEHISALAVAISSGNLSRAKSVAEMLYAANVESLNARYGDRHPDMIQPFEFDRDDAANTGGDHPIAMIKSCRCFTYQACEYNGWTDSIACMLIEQLVMTELAKLNELETCSFDLDTVTNHPKWNRATWGTPGFE